MNSKESAKHSSLNISSYLQMLVLSFIRPDIYPSRAALFGRVQIAVLILIINSCLFILTKTAATVIITGKPVLLFQATLQIIQLTPFALIMTFLLTGVFHSLAKFLGGFGLFQNSFNAVVYASFPLILAWVPVLSILMYILVIYYLLITFIKVHNFIFAKSLIVIMLPTMFILVILIVLKLVDLSLLVI